MDEDNFISVIDFANESGCRKQTVFKVIKRLGINTLKRKASEKHGQSISYITEQDAEALTQELSVAINLDNEEVVNNDFGSFYLIQLEPEFDSGRFKVGFTTNLNERLRSHRCSAPFAQIVKTWSCRNLWEKTAIDAICSEVEQLHTEVFRANSIAEIQDKADQFFALMPTEIDDEN